MFFGIVLFDALGRSPNYAGFAGFFVGLSISAKYNVGLVALVGLLGVAWLSARRRDRTRTLRWILSGVTASILIATVLPIFVLGDFGEFVDQVLDKRAYTATGSISPLVGLNDLFGKLQSLDLVSVLASPGFMILTLSIVAILASFRLLRNRDNRTWWCWRCTRLLLRLRRPGWSRCMSHRPSLVCF